MDAGIWIVEDKELKDIKVDSQVACDCVDY